MTYEKSAKSANFFECIICDFNTCKKCDFNRHLKTLKQFNFSVKKQYKKTNKISYPILNTYLGKSSFNICVIKHI